MALLRPQTPSQTIAQAEPGKQPPAHLFAGAAWLAAGLLLSFLTASGAALWDTLSATPRPLDSGFIGLLAWQGAFRLLGLAGATIARLVAALLLWAAWPRVEGEKAGNAGALLQGVLFLAACALMPEGSDALLLPALVAMSRLPLAAACSIAILLPALTPLYLFGALSSSLALWSHERRRGALAVLACAIASPWGASGIITGEAFAAFPLSWIGHPSYYPLGAAAFSLPLVLWTVSVSFLIHWDNPKKLGAAAANGIAAFALRPLAAFPAAQAAQDQRSNLPLRAALLILFPFALAARLALPSPVIPREAESALAGLPNGNWQLQAEPGWSGRAAFLLHGKAGAAVSPRASFRDALDFWRRHPKGLKPPFADENSFDGDLLLISPDYPATPEHRPLQPGWSLAAAGPDYALFAKQTPLMAGYLKERALQAYDPFEPLPSEPEQRRQALAEALALLKASPRFFEPLRDAGRMETDFGQLDDALSHLTLASAIKPRDAQLQNDLGVVFQKQGRKAEAERAYLLSIQLNPQELLPRLNLAALYADDGRWAQAELVLRDMIRRREGFFPAYRMLVQVLMSQGKTEEARSVVLSIPPDSRTPEEAALAGDNQAPVPAPAEGGGQDGRR